MKALTEDIGAPSLLHFLYKSKTHVQFTCPDVSPPYTIDSNRKRWLDHLCYLDIWQFTDPAENRLHRLCQHVYERMHNRARPLKLYYYDSGQEIVLGWVCKRSVFISRPCAYTLMQITASFELYVVFKPNTPKSTLISSSNQLLRWIKRNEDNLFIVDSPVF